jgi:ParB family transcriptional regulator, chromosome partitioning protein
MEMKMREPISTAVDIPLDQIKVPRNRMRSLRPEGVAVLADSMRKLRLIMPIIVRPRKGGGYWLVGGWHRLEAAKRLGWSTISADVWRLSRLEAKLVEIDDNLCVAPLSCAERLILADQKDELTRRASATPY